MPKFLFTDEQKSNLAKEAGITGVPDTNSFNKEYDPSTGEEKLYMKMGQTGKFFGAKPTTARPADPIQRQVDYVQEKYGGKTMQDIASAMLSTTPSTKGAIRDQIAAGPGGIGSQLEGITQQINNLNKLRAGNQSEIFSAVGPDGKPIDPRIAVANYKSTQKAYDDQENNLRKLEDMYNSQLGALTDSEYQKQAAENEKNKVAMGYMKDIEDKKIAADKVATDKEQFDAKLKEEQRQYNTTNNITTPLPEILSSTSFTDRASLYPNEASLKNNNPAGIKNTINDRTRQLLIDGGVQWEGGTKPPPGESGSYMKFKTVADGVKAHRILLTSAGTDDVNARLQQWVGTKEGPTYAKNIMNEAGIPDGAKFSSLSNDQLDKLVDAHMKKESPGFARELNALKEKSAPVSGKKPATFNEYVEKVQIPDIQLDEKGIDEMFAAVQKDYPTETIATIASAMRNRAPAGMQKAIDAYSEKKLGEATQQEEAKKISEGLDKMTAQTTTGKLRVLGQTLKDPTKVIETLHQAGFFDVYGPHWNGDDDQYDSVQKYAEDNGLDLETLIKDLNDKK